MAEVVNTLFAVKRDQPVNIPQFIYDQQAVLFQDYRGYRADRNVFTMFIKLQMLQLIDTVVFNDLVIYEKGGD